ncbi:hypothetical protein [Protaetiibacter larvae]|uniref:Uncharacterized protein n=1 Tax=Protaetiibacter larvae TaxID=2592654 RepID=A0A5C1Y812_9MICO|nr:hypothetical protein [Protaetiibacter larvae]QEO09770.1 hypothetical protein FLP23_06985 [Protaetiibacter larvae]
MGASHEGWWTLLGLSAGASGTKVFDRPYWDARLGPLREYPPIAFCNPETGHAVSLEELVGMIAARSAELELSRRRL